MENLSRLETFLDAMVNGTEANITPQSRAEVYYQQLLEKMNDLSGGGGDSVGKSTTGTVYAINDEEVTAAEGAEIFNDYTYNIASGPQSHAEGGGTKAIGPQSHAEGSNTIATAECQHVQGRYNIEDTNGDYIHIVGNGVNNNARSNAHTLDWSGNAWFAGMVEATSIILKSSTPGSTKRFKITVDDSGVLTVAEIG